MDKIECIAMFVLAILVAIGPLAMFVDLLWRRRGEDRFIVEVWNADHTRLITILTANPGDWIPPNGQRIVDLEELHADEPQQRLDVSEGAIERERGEQSKSLERGHGSHCFAAKTRMPHKHEPEGYVRNRRGVARSTSPLVA